jgi:outer membrane protein assembly factor BamB
VIVMMTVSHWIACALLLFLDGPWPQFRGPQSNGHAGNLEIPSEWSDTQQVVWKVEVPGLGWSSPVLADGRVYLTTAVAQGEGLSLRVLAMDQSTGAMVWDRQVREIAKAPPIHAKNSHASPTPILADGKIYVHFGPLGMARLDRQDGEIDWICQELDYPPVHGSGGSPMLVDGKLVVVCDGSSSPFVAAVDANTGKVLWKTPRSVEARISHSFVTPNVFQVDGRWQVMAPGPNHFAAYDLADGKELWRIRADGWSVVPQPLIYRDLVIYNHDYDNPELIAARLGGSGDVTDSHVVWRLKRGAPSTPTPLLIGDELYFVSDTGIASCVDAGTGEKHWMERIGGNFSSSPIFVDGKILLLDEDGVATWIRPGKAFETLGKNELPGRTLATPAFLAGAMFLRTDQHLYRFGK